MKNIFKNMIGAFVLMAVSYTAFAETTLYSIRVDGLACPYCAYGIEKKMNAIQGVKFINMDLKKGVVTAESYDTKLEDDQLKKLFQDSGFTYRGKKEHIK